MVAVDLVLWLRVLSRILHRLRLSVVSCILVTGGFFSNALADALETTVARVKASIVGVGTFQKVRSPPGVFSGTGFVVADGLHVVTNVHVLPREISVERSEGIIVLIGTGAQAQKRDARLVGVDREHDLALLQIDGPALPALTIADSSTVREGRSLAFTGFPIGMALGLYPATHRATVAAIVPVARPGITAKQLNPRLVNRLRDSAYTVFQLDGIAYAGNSGSPLFDPDSGHVYGVINSVFIRGTREQAITRPSGITYAIPSEHIQALLTQAKLPASQ